MNENRSIVKNNKVLRCGFTTGSCATAVATAATKMLLTGRPLSAVNILLPSGEKVLFMVEDIVIDQDRVSCSVTKDAGDDPDVTDGIKIFAESSVGEREIRILVGTGIGIVTSKGLPCNVGEPAINPVPKSMIIKNVSRICEEFQYKNGINIKLSVPKGEEIAKKTFNPRLGIIGGISILGTSGIVEPMSERAIIDTIKTLIDKHKYIEGDKVLISPGNYGRDYCKKVLEIDINRGIKFSNFVGETLDYLVYKDYKKVLLVGHIGKLIKLAGGVMNTHSSVADCRMEILAAHCGLMGANKDFIQDIMECSTTDEAIEILNESDICEKVMESIIEKIMFHIQYRVKDHLQVEVILFSQGGTMIAKSKDADKFVEMFVEEDK